MAFGYVQVAQSIALQQTWAVVFIDMDHWYKVAIIARHPAHCTLCIQTSWERAFFYLHF